MLTAWVALILSVLLRPAWHDLPEDPWLWLKTYGLVLPPVAGWCVAVGALMPHILQGAPGVRVRAGCGALNRLLFARRVDNPRTGDEPACVATPQLPFGRS